MNASEYLSKITTREGYNFQFKKAALFKDGQVVKEMNDVYTYIRQGGMFGGMMTVIEFYDVLEFVQPLGAMRNFSYGKWDFFANWRRLSIDPLSFIQSENSDGVTTIKLTADNTNNDILLDFNMPPFTLKLYNCYNLY